MLRKVTKRLKDNKGLAIEGERDREKKFLQKGIREFKALHPLLKKTQWIRLRSPQGSAPPGKSTA